MASLLKTSAPTTDAAHLRYDPEALEAARVIAVLVPGVLSRTTIFEAADAWHAAGYGLVHYCFPGLDGRPLNPALDLDAAAEAIATLLQRYPNKPLRLVGYSTGTAIVLKAATQLEGRDLRLAAIAPAVERAGGLRTTWRSGKDLLRAARRARSVAISPVWFSFYPVLLYGRGVYDDTSLARRAEALIAERRHRIVVPTRPLVRAHTRALKRWRLSAAERTAGRDMTLYWGEKDAIFDHHQVDEFARRCGGAKVRSYPDQGHLLFATCPEVFDDVFAQFEA